MKESLKVPTDIVAPDPQEEEKQEMKESEISSNSIEKYSTNDEDLQSRLTQLQYEVTQNAATEPAYNNTYWDVYDD
jgi:peptide methionine sulfoxide reductase MsrB